MAKRANQINLKLKRIDWEIRRVCYIQWQSWRSFLKTRTNWGFKIYEKLLNHALAVQEWLDGKIYHRDSNK
jgi:hypothetical protein